MRVVAINSVINGSTGNIMLNISRTIRNLGGEAYTFSEKHKGQTAPFGHSFFGSSVENLMHRIYSVSTGISGTGSKSGTKKLIQKIKAIDPDILFLNNLHGWYINIPMLFDFIRESKLQTFWTLHDCWGFTAQCSHFVLENCDKWKTGCYSCPRYKLYPYTFVDKTDKMWSLKKKWLTDIPNLSIVVPAKWLANLAKLSFLGDYDIRVINNGINLDVFKPTESDFRKTYGLENKKIVLGVASGWTYRKGLDVFIELAKRVTIDYKIVLVGTDPNIDKLLPNSILSIHKTNNQQELAEIYTAADVFFNPTREDTFASVNIEALSCGTPVVVFRTGGCPEIITEQTGFVVGCNDVENSLHFIKEICENNVICSNNCIERAKLFDMNMKFKEYYNLFKASLS